MTWSPAKLHIQKVNVQRPKPPGAVVQFTIIGGGFKKGLDVFFVHKSASAAQFVSAIMNSRGSSIGVVQATNLNVVAGQVNCSADMRKMKGGKYDAFVVEVTGGQVWTAVMEGAFNWRRR